MEKFYKILYCHYTNGMFYFFQDLISFYGNQYKIYGKALANKFKFIVEAEE